MASIIPFIPNARAAFQFDATLDGRLHSVLVTWNVSGQRWYINVHDADRKLVVCRALAGSPTPRPLAPPPAAEPVASMTWAATDGGRVYFAMVEPSHTVKLGKYVNVSGAVNVGLAGNGAVNGTFLIDQFIDQLHFSALLTANAGEVGAISGSVLINPSASALTYRRGQVVATTQDPHKYPLGSVVRLAMADSLPSGYNGTFYCVVTGPSEFRYRLGTDPGQPAVRAGSYSPDLNLLDGYFNSSLMVYRAVSQQFEVRP